MLHYSQGWVIASCNNIKLCFLSDMTKKNLPPDVLLVVIHLFEIGKFSLLRWLESADACNQSKAMIKQGKSNMPMTERVSAWRETVR